MNKSNVHQLNLYLIIVEINCNNSNKQKSRLCINIFISKLVQRYILNHTSNIRDI